MRKSFNKFSFVACNSTIPRSRGSLLCPRASNLWKPRIQMQMYQTIPLLTLKLVRTWYEKPTPYSWRWHRWTVGLGQIGAGLLVTRQTMLPYWFLNLTFQVHVLLKKKTGLGEAHQKYTHKQYKITSLRGWIGLNVYGATVRKFCFLHARFDTPTHMTKRTNTIDSAIVIRSPQLVFMGNSFKKHYLDVLLLEATAWKTSVG